MRIGQGYDAHRFGQGDHIILGGVEIPFDKGLAAHSDGDVLLHAICDALLGAVALGDIGSHFPDSDPGLKDVSSRVLLRRVTELLREAGYALCNIPTNTHAWRHPGQYNPGFISAAPTSFKASLGVKNGCKAAKYVVVKVPLAARTGKYSTRMQQGLVARARSRH